MTSTQSVHFSSHTVDWGTPRDFFARLDAVFHFTLDPCASPDNATCARFYTRDDDGLSRSWDGERVFLNPPYGREIGRWVEKAATSQALTVALLPARTDTRWWQQWVIGAEAFVVFLRGRLAFGDGQGSAPFPSALVVFAGGVLQNPPRSKSDHG